MRSLNAIRGCDLCFQRFGGRKESPSEEVESVLLRASAEATLTQRGLSNRSKQMIRFREQNYQPVHKNPFNTHHSAAWG